MSWDFYLEKCTLKMYQFVIFSFNFNKEGVMVVLPCNRKIMTDGQQKI